MQRGRAHPGWPCRRYRGASEFTTFLSLLPDSAEQHAVLRRRLDFLEAPASFFYDGDTPLRAEQVADPYRRGMLLTARATSRAERAWLREVLDGDGIRAADEQPHSRDRKD